MVKRLIKKIVPKFILLFYHFFLSYIGAFLYGFPSSKLRVVGVTGTKGKSTTVNLIGRILEEAGYRTGWTSTVNFKIGKKEWLNDLKMTMPGRFNLQRLLKQMVKEKCDYVVLETSSEGILQGRHLGINYDAALFTNLSPEHIEAHGSFEKYKEAKMKLFKRLKKKKKIGGKEINKTIIVNLDNSFYPSFLRFPADKKYGFTLENKEENLEIIKAEEINLHSHGCSFKIQGKEFDLNLLGRFNLYNALGAIAFACSEGISLGICAKALEKIKSIPGRLEFINQRQNFQVIIDYAHEPVSLEELYKTIKEIIKPKGKIIHLLGSCGGGRDKGRRFVLGEMAGKEADYVIVTNEDPYNEDPWDIINEVARGVKERQKEKRGLALFKILDRGEAIKKAMELAKKDDLVLITGKGAEQAIVVKNNKKIPWDDREKARKALNNSQNGNH